MTRLGLDRGYFHSLPGKTHPSAPKGIPGIMSSISKLGAAVSVSAAVAASALGLPPWADDRFSGGLRLAQPGDATGAYALISTSVPPAPVTSLVPNDRGYVRVETKSESIGCSINTELVACQTAADNWPPGPSGRHFHTASVNANGDFNWVEADLGALEGRIVLDFQTYAAQGWTIVADSDATKFSNDRSGHGMSVSDQSVTPF